MIGTYLNSAERTPLVLKGNETLFVGAICPEGPAWHTAIFKTKFSVGNR